MLNLSAVLQVFTCEFNFPQLKDLADCATSQPSSLLQLDLHRETSSHFQDSLFPSNFNVVDPYLDICIYVNQNVR